jgi:hypothetical protein
MATDPKAYRKAYDDRGKGKNPHDVREGQVWEDMDERERERGGRFLHVRSIDSVTGRATVERVRPVGGRRDLFTLDSSYRPSTISLHRFKPGSRGYTLVQDVPRWEVE